MTRELYDFVRDAAASTTMSIEEVAGMLNRRYRANYMDARYPALLACLRVGYPSRLSPLQCTFIDKLLCACSMQYYEYFVEMGEVAPAAFPAFDDLNGYCAKSLSADIIRSILVNFAPLHLEAERLHMSNLDSKIIKVNMQRYSYVLQAQP